MPSRRAGQSRRREEPPRSRIAADRTGVSWPAPTCARATCRANLAAAQCRHGPASGRRKPLLFSADRPMRVWFGRLLVGLPHAVSDRLAVVATTLSPARASAVSGNVRNPVTPPVQSTGSLVASPTLYRGARSPPVGKVADALIREARMRLCRVRIATSPGSADRTANRPVVLVVGGQVQILVMSRCPCRAS